MEKRGSVIAKKRELLPELNSIINKLANASGDVAKLEMFDNLQASKRVRALLIELKNKDIKNLLDKVKDIRYEIRSDRKGKAEDFTQ